MKITFIKILIFQTLSFGKMKFIREKNSKKFFKKMKNFNPFFESFYPFYISHFDKNLSINFKKKKQKE